MEGRTWPIHMQYQLKTAVAQMYYLDSCSSSLLHERVSKEVAKVCGCEQNFGHATRDGFQQDALPGDNSLHIKL